MSPPNPSNATIQLSLDTRILEMAYGEACGHVEMLCESEKARHLRLQILLLENENNELYNQLVQADARIDELENCAIGERQECETAIRQVDSVQSDLRIKTREVETLKAELTSLCGVKMDSTKLLTEKLTLARELSVLRPEIDHLRSQNSSFQSLLSEKLSLQRQLSTLQVEMENERRSKQRLSLRGDKVNAGDAKLGACLEAFQAELAKEKGEKANADREVQKSFALFQNKITMYESRLDAFRDKLKSTKETLKEVRSELQRYQTANDRPGTTVAQPKSQARSAQKRAASDMGADTMIGTPGDLAPAKSKKSRLTTLGEKSTFSTTPFLNRTASRGREDPSLIETRRHDQNALEPQPSSPNVTLKNQKLAQPTILTMTDKNVVEDEGEVCKTAPDPVARKGKKFSARKPPRKSIASSKLLHVAEELNSHQASEDAISRSTKTEDLPNQLVDDGLEKKTIRRKVLGVSLGKTLFDEDDGDILKGDRRIGATKAFVTQRKGKLGEANVNVGTARNFGPFSPLKKDRRAGAV